MAYFTEYVIGIVNTTPIQQPIKPTNEAIPATINNRARISGCLPTMIILDFIASVTFKFPKIINGMVSEVNNEITNESNVSIAVIPIRLNPIEINALKKPINNVAVNIREK